MTSYLTASEERRLIAAAMNGDIAARNRVIMNIYYYIRKMVGRSFSKTDQESEDAVQYVIAVLCEKFHKFESNLNCRYITYAHYWVRQALQQFRLKQELIHSPRKKKRLNPESTQNNETTKIVFFQQADSSDKDFFNEAPVSHEGSPSCRLETEESVDELLQLMSQLYPREKYVLQLRSDGQKLQAIGDLLGLSKERIRQIESSAIQRIKKHHSQGAII